jgi:two-component system nitrate/nitrite response regulator NarL
VGAIAQAGARGAGWRRAETGGLFGRRKIKEAPMERELIWNAPRQAVLVVPNVLLKEGLTRILSEADFSIIASSSFADDHILSTLPHEQTVLLIIDVSDDLESGLRQIASFKRRHPGGRVAVLGDQRNPTEMVSAFRAGANAYLVKIASCEAFIKSLELVLLGVTFLPPEILGLVSDRKARNAIDSGHGDDDDDDDGNDDVGMVGSDVETSERMPTAVSSGAPQLSVRQQSILRRLVQGDSNKSIARRMAMAEATVKVHVKAILRKIGVHNRTQAAIWAMRNGSSFLAKNDDLHALDELPGELFSNLDVLQFPAERSNGSASLPSFNGASRIAIRPSQG